MNTRKPKQLSTWQELQKLFLGTLPAEPVESVEPAKSPYDDFLIRIPETPKSAKSDSKSTSRSSSNATPRSDVQSPLSARSNSGSPVNSITEIPNGQKDEWTVKQYAELNLGRRNAKK